MPIPLGEELREIGNMFFFLSYLIFNCFYIYHFYICIRVLNFMYLLCRDAGLVCPTNFTRTL
jgi:hypothetical protein